MRGAVSKRHYEESQNNWAVAHYLSKNSFSQRNKHQKYVEYHIQWLCSKFIFQSWSPWYAWNGEDDDEELEFWVKCFNRCIPETLESVKTSAALGFNNNSSHSLWSWRRSRLRFELNMNVKLFYLVIKRSQSSTFFGIIIKTFIISTLLMWGIDKLYHLLFIRILFHKFIYLNLYKMINWSKLVRGVKLEVPYPWFTSINWLKSDSIQ